MRKMDIINRLKQDSALVEKYYHCGIYSISIDDRLVYIGKSQNMLYRLGEHIFYTMNTQLTKSHKYYILKMAKALGHKINFDVLCYTDFSTLGQIEGELIRKYLPPLNYQIPREDNSNSFTVNRAAKTITLDEILGENK